MVELEAMRSAETLIWTFAWQASAFLALGLAASFALRGRPARGHQALLLAMLAAVAAPTLTQAGRRLGWGLWNATTPTAVRSTAARSPVEPGPGPMPAASPEPRWVGAPVPPSRTAPTLALASANDAPVARVSAWSFPWRTAFLTAWAVVSGLLGVRLAASFWRGWSLARGATVVEDDSRRAGLEAAARGLRLHVNPAVGRSPAVRCPAVWCWGRRPLLLLPEGQGSEPVAIDWVAVFRHELAHWRRRDHLSSLASELLVCVLPWNPLAWGARARLAQLAELACDDWVLAAGTPASDYAATLLGLTPQRLSPALAAVSGGNGLRGRIVRILSDRRREPAAGRRWTAAACLAMILAASLAALAQARPNAKSDEPPKAAAAPGPGPDLTHARGQVLDPDGKPVGRAKVFWIGNRKPRLPYVALPRGDRDALPRIETIALAETDGEGGFQLSAPFRAEDFVKYNGVEVQMVVVAPGHGILSEKIAAKDLDRELTFKLARQEVIRGRLLTPGGMPAAGVRVLLNGYHNDETKQGLFVGREAQGEPTPDFWPRPTETDADGRFTVEGVPVGVYATIAFHHPDYAVDEVTVNTIPERTLSPSIKGFEIVPVEPTFTHALEPARPVEGRVTDKASGAPLAGILVEMIPMRRHGGQVFTTRTDADGRYRVSGHSTDGTYFITAFPPADSGYLSLSDRREGWPAGASTMTVDLPLDAGRLVSGRVVDLEGKRPVAGAAVMYQPEPRNPNNTRDYDLRNSVVADADGRFRITALKGRGFLAVEGNSDVYARRSRKSASRDEAIHPHGLVEIDVPEQGEPAPAEIVLRRGKPLEARLLGPDGLPVDRVTAMYDGIDAALVDVWNQGRPFTGGTFRIAAADPERIYRVLFLNVERRLGAVAELKADPSGKPLEVRLLPTATIKGKVATADGHVMEGAGASIRLLLRSERKEYTRDELFEPSVAQHYSNFLGQDDFYFHDRQPGPDGSFSFEAMIPGVGYNVSGGLGDREVSELVWDLKPGEVRDLGTLTPKEVAR
ncbi:carboxypeptidase regulatory-like domain-containing protein [Paludisphaera soli]|uniref:carboxypeptidase regulatory-like domain-containing protein n=1 Tax=Paludisphaera soli TaxID=2712865 RepID=UPI0013ECE6F3|nr:carboxypeptidase regulatory-like domain-containing protein [Paludisphaera soli]